MAADANDNMGLKISMIVFVLLWLVFTVMWYMTYKEVDQHQSTSKAATDKLRESDAALKRYQNEVELLKNKIGHKYEKVGAEGSSDANEVLGAMNIDIKNYGGNVAQGTYKATILELRTQFDKIAAQKAQLEKTNTSQEKLIQALRNTYQQQVVKHQGAVNEAEKTLEGQIEKSEELLANKDKELTDLSRNLGDTTLRLDESKEAFNSMKNQKDSDINSLEQTNDFLQERLDKVTDVSFEKADGNVLWVDNASGLAWINLGTEDKLPKNTTFSVYEKLNRGVARSDKDVKGTIEITRVLGAHIAEARITSSKLGRPISPEDVIYTPIWQPGRKEFFTLVGKIDLDNDGQDDSDLLIDLIRSGGADMDNHVMPNGEMTGKGITVNTKFLVRGEIPNLEGLPPNSVKAEQAKAVGKHFLDLEKQARRNAVRVISLSDFLSYIGYTPRRRIFKPGAGNTYTLKAGSRSASTSDTIISRESSGQVSGAFDKSKTYSDNSSSGQTSSAFKK